MPQNKHALARYRIIHSLLKKNDYVKSIDIVDICVSIIGYSVSQRTIQLDIDAMKYDDLLGLYAPISYCRRNRAYYYEDPEYVLERSLFSIDDILLLETIFIKYRTVVEQCDILIMENLINKFKLFSN